METVVPWFRATRQLHKRLDGCSQTDPTVATVHVRSTDCQRRVRGHAAFRESANAEVNNGLQGNWGEPNAALAQRRRSAVAGSKLFMQVARLCPVQSEPAKVQLVTMSLQVPPAAHSVLFQSIQTPCATRRNAACRLSHHGAVDQVGCHLETSAQWAPTLPAPMFHVRIGLQCRQGPSHNAGPALRAGAN